MATLVLGTAGSVLGGAVGGPFGAAIGASLGRLAGGSIDNALFGNDLPVREGPRLADLAVQTSTYGKMIPLVFGTVRLAGNIIWSRPIKETATTTSNSAGGKGGGGVKQTATTYSYSVSLAIAICEGPIDAVLRIWADAKPLDLSQGTYRIYKGTEAQLPDGFIEAYEGVGTTPAYRGMAYLVVEDFPLGDFGNRIPNFTFEVKKKSQYPDYQGDVLENIVESIILIPGSGEFVYDTKIQSKTSGETVGSGFAQTGNRIAINMQNPNGVANALVALDQLQETLPNVGWVGLVVTWFGTSIDAGSCVILPGVEYQSGAATAPDTWGVAGFSRTTAHQITLVGDSPRYGGTPDDASVLRLIDEIRSRGLKVMFYPMFFMDVDGKPWRGRVTGSASDVASFFTKTNGYNAFITHYANLVKTKVDAFIIGSELIGLTKVTPFAGSYPAVSALVSLAASVKSIMGSTTKLTYAADWSEYHHTDGGWYNLDPLWASSNIDFIGIDAYFPLTNTAQHGYDMDAVMQGWHSGEGWDFYYADTARTDQQPLSAPYAWKNIRWWWEHTHTNPNGVTTSWTPSSKPIWFTEFGFPSVDGATNQPNVFYDPTSVESFLPRFSRGRVDFRAQRLGLMATLEYWKASDMIERSFIWTWDARPFPYWPDRLDVWADGAQWKTGHWVEGKLGISSLAAIVKALCLRVGLTANDIDVSQLTELVEGYILSSPQTARAAIEMLMQGYFFDAVESGMVLKFVPRGGALASTILEDRLVRADGEPLTITRRQEVELPRQVNVLTMNRTADYQQGNQSATRQATESQEIMTLSLPIVFADQGAKVLADQWLYTSWVNRTSYTLHVSMENMALEPTDMINVQTSSATHRMRITESLLAKPGILRLRGVAEDADVYDIYQPPSSGNPSPSQATMVDATQLVLLDLPAFPTDGMTEANIRLAATGLASGWRGAVVYRSEDNGANYATISTLLAPAVMGVAASTLGVGASQTLDETNNVDVLLLGEGELSSAPLLSVLNGANAARLGGEVIQFTTATLISAGKYRLSGLLRGRQGTESAMGSHAAGESFVLLNTSLDKIPMPQGSFGADRLYKPVSVGATLGSTVAQHFAYTAQALKPYAPVHLAGSRNGAGDLTLSWIRRTRISGEWRDFVDVPLNEAFERYEVEILNGSSVVRTFAATSPLVVYTASQQTSDFGSAQASLSVRVYQLSEMVGRGSAGSGVV